jgi:hypothetical protein
MLEHYYLPWDITGLSEHFFTSFLFTLGHYLFVRVLFTSSMARVLVRTITYLGRLLVS